MDTAEKKPPRILVVDDDEHLLVALRDALVFDGFEVKLARDGAQALAQISRGEPDLIVLDIGMPGMGGIAFLKRISSAEGHLQYPVLVYTAKAAMEGFFAGMEVDGFILKPSTPFDVTKAIRDILAKRRRLHDRQVRQKRVVLLAEDDPDVARKLRETLGGAGYEVRVVDNGADALDKVLEERPDGILMKQVLPRLNGNVVANMMMNLPGARTIPIVLYDDTGARIEGDRFAGAPTNVTRFLGTADHFALLKSVRDALSLAPRRCMESPEANT